MFQFYIKIYFSMSMTEGGWSEVLAVNTRVSLRRRLAVELSQVSSKFEYIRVKAWRHLQEQVVKGSLRTSRSKLGFESLCERSWCELARGGERSWYDSRRERERERSESRGERQQERREITKLRQQASTRERSNGQQERREIKLKIQFCKGEWPQWDLWFQMGNLTIKGLGSYKNKYKFYPFFKNKKTQQRTQFEFWSGFMFASWVEHLGFRTPKRCMLYSNILCQY